MEDKYVPKIDSKKLVIGETLGMGGQSIVRKGEYKGNEVAIKSILQMGDNQFSEFLKEIKLLCSFKHENILKTYGICQQSQELLLVVEKMDTDLEKVLNKLDPQGKFNCCFQICEAIKYLHSFEPPILHRDLKPSNILVNKKGVFKLSDFGVSRVSVSKFQENTMTKDAGTLLYMAPEILVSSKYSELADIYSLGLLYTEIYIEKNPYHKIEIMFLLDLVEKYNKKEMIPDYPTPEENFCPPLFVSLIKQMTSYSPKERPPASIILQTLKEKRMEVQLQDLLKTKQK